MFLSSPMLHLFGFLQFTKSDSKDIYKFFQKIANW